MRPHVRCSRSARLLALTLVLLLAACATPYQPRGYTGGFSETRVGENMFRVRFAGNGYTSTERATDFALLRAAEIALAHGYTHFAIVESADRVHVSISGRDGDIDTTASPSAMNTIVCYHGKPDGRLSYDAAFVVEEVRAKYELDAK